MKIVVIGGGAREHALVWKLKQSPRVERVWCIPGNAGIGEACDCVSGGLLQVKDLADRARDLQADLTIVGPEQPLVLGIVDEFEKRGLQILGPSRAAARLEGSKIFAKEFMARHKIPTASVYGVFENAADAYTSLCEVDWPVVLKADGLCAGKGVLVTSSPDEATSFIERLMERGEFGEAGSRLLIEEGLKGRELSYIVLTDGRSVCHLAPSRDYKRAFDGDRGPNTGGMGAISTTELLSNNLRDLIEKTIVTPTIRGLTDEGCKYRGFLYFGLMLTDEGPKVLEYNCRMGDPETEALVMRMNFDLAEAAMAATSDELGEFRANWSPAASACVVVASEGYPGKPIVGRPLSGLQKIRQGSGLAVFHGATTARDTMYYTSSGRVLAVSAAGDSLEEARASVYEAVRAISFEGMQYRTDIGSGDKGAAQAQLSV